MYLIIFPIQLYNPKFIDLKKYNNIIIIEEPRYFTDFLFHKLKLAYHRASMKKYYDTLKELHSHVKYIEFHQVNNNFYKKLEEIYIYDPYDKKLIDKLNKIVKVNIINNLQFLVEPHELTKQNIFYVTTEFTCVQVTEITEERTFSHFNDAVYLGQVYDHGIYKDYKEFCSEEEKSALIEKKKELYKK